MTAKKGRKCLKCKGAGRVELLGLYLVSNASDGKAPCFKCNGTGSVSK